MLGASIVSCSFAASAVCAHLVPLASYAVYGSAQKEASSSEGSIFSPVSSFTNRFMTRSMRTPCSLNVCAIIARNFCWSVSAIPRSGYFS